MVVVVSETGSGMPRETRRRIIRALKTLKTKVLTNPAKKHDNIPL